MSMIYSIRTICLEKDERFKDDIKTILDNYEEDYTEDSVWEAGIQLMDVEVPTRLFSEKGDGFRYTSFWVFPDGKIQWVEEGVHERTACGYVDSDGCHLSEDTMSETCVRYSNWLKCRLPLKVTDRQKQTLLSMSAHKDYKLLVKDL